MYYVYLIQSLKNGSLYVGRTGDLKQRLSEHNSGKSTYTNLFKPYRLIYYEAYLDQRDAINREGKLKHHGSVIGHLRKRLNKSLTSSSQKGGV